MNQPFQRSRSLTHHQVVLGSLCASLLALACGSDPAADPSRADADEPAPLPQVVATPSAPTDVVPASPTAPEAVEPAPITEPPPAEEPPAEEPPPARVCETALSFDDLYAAVDDDLRSEGDDGVFLRYVSLSNRLNQGICTEDLANDRLAMIKALNSLSTENSIVLPEAIDDADTVYRIDLRDLGWDQPTLVDGVAFDDKWEAILAATPFAVQFEGDEADQAKLNANTTVPVLSADALIDAATVGNLYYALLDIGETEADLLAQLGVDEEDVVLRAGTSRSGLSRQDALMERLDLGAIQGYYWSRYDSDADGAGQSIFVDPLGFVADSISAVFSLPNGLNGYALFDGAGVRQQESDVLVDSLQRDGRVNNSVSCSRCHAAGLNPIADEVREYVEANPLDFGDTFGDVLDDFPVQAEIDDLIADDSERYLAALSRAGLSAAQADPVSAGYLRFDADVTLSVAAGELGVTPERLSRDLGALSNRVDPALAALRTRSLQRGQFDALYLPTLCALLVASDNRPAAADCAAVGQ